MCEETHIDTDTHIRRWWKQNQTILCKQRIRKAQEKSQNTTVCICVGCLYSPFGVDCSPREIALVKTNSFSVSGYSQFWVRDRSLCLLLITGTTLLTVQARGVLPQCPRIHVRSSCCVYMPCSLGVFHPAYLTLFPLSLLQSSLSLEGRDLETSHLGMNVPKSVCTLLSCGSLSLFPSATGSFCDGGWTRHWPMSRAVCLKGSFRCCSFSRTVVLSYWVFL